jgi:protein gp37
MARRLKAMGQDKYSEGFVPTFHPEELRRPARWKKPRRIFVCSMSDLFGDWFGDDIINDVIQVARDCPRHTFQFLTKHPMRYRDFSFPDNALLGATVADQAALEYTQEAMGGGPSTFLSVEPILGPIDLDIRGTSPGWVIIGRMTGPGSKRAPFEPRWVHNLTEQAQGMGIPIFHKNNLGDLATLQQFPGVR